ncbi:MULTISPECIES: hypothetical protein [Lacticaseibacillus]|uniref:Uncharacterized protein n=1 Tax=Lacticaseibacillus hegangensis TaxID=2486010 RepID=A0ABW4CZF0_9LACO|nr:MULTISPECIES: hypothetical protein [Lacticaseibacillus]
MAKKPWTFWALLVIGWVFVIIGLYSFFYGSMFVAMGALCFSALSLTWAAFEGWAD